MCVVTKTTMSVVSSNPFYFSSNLLAVSSDDGEKWTFMNAPDNSITVIRQSIPEICEVANKINQ